MTLKVLILICLRRLFIILVSLMMKWFSEKMLISTRCIHGFMSNLIKKSWKDSSLNCLKSQKYRWKIFLPCAVWGLRLQCNFVTLFWLAMALNGGHSWHKAILGLPRSVLLDLDYMTLFSPFWRSIFFPRQSNCHCTNTYIEKKYLLQFHEVLTIWLP